MKNEKSSKEVNVKRRNFMKTAAKAAIVAPAVTVLMSANIKEAQADVYGPK